MRRDNHRMSNFEPGDPARIEVPDDASALDADRWRYYDELAAAGALSHSPDQLQDVHHPSRWRDGLPWLGSNGTQRVPVFFLVVSGLAMVACVLLAFVVRPAAPAAGAALAVNAGPAGQEGGLLPAMTVNVDGRVATCATCGRRCWPSSRPVTAPTARRLWPRPTPWRAAGPCGSTSPTIPPLPHASAPPSASTN